MIDFWKITPGGNPTLLLRAEDVPAGDRVALSNRIMNPQHLGAEQVGFVRLPAGSVLPRLDMMGGEFCLNATRAFAMLLVLENALPLENAPFRRWQGEVEVSGVEGPVAVLVEEFPGEGRPRYAASVALRIPSLPAPERVARNVEIVRLPGIVHIIFSQAGIPPDPELPAFCADLRRRHSLEEEEAVGVMWLSGPENGHHRLFPVVWVRDTLSLCLESACGSGTLACALALRHRGASDTFEIVQPSGFSLGVRLERQTGASVLAHVGGPVTFVAQGRLNPGF